MTTPGRLSPPGAIRLLASLQGGLFLSSVRMQGAYDAWHAERSVDVSKIPVLVAA